MTTIKRHEDRQPGRVSYTLNDGRPQPKIRTITLSSQPPVTILEDRWPIIAQTTHSGDDGRAFLKIRQHADGRTLVYGGYDYTSRWQGETDHHLRRGVFLRDNSVSIGDLLTAIRAVASDLLTADDGDLAQECIADLPAEQI